MDWRVSLIVGLVVGWFAHTLAVSRDRRSARRSAAKDFQASVLDALSGLYPLPTSWPDTVDASLRQLFAALQRAVAAFRPYLPAWRRWAFDEPGMNIDAVPGATSTYRITTITSDSRATRTLRKTSGATLTRS
jgi:hypothetical protein